MVKKAVELSDSEVANITFKAYSAIINFIDERIGINNTMDIDISFEALRNDKLTFDISINVKLNPLVNVNIDEIIDESINKAFQVIDYELSRVLEKV